MLELPSAASDALIDHNLIKTKLLIIITFLDDSSIFTPKFTIIFFTVLSFLQI